ncbi:hypothetical protein ACIP6T_23680 [Pantoea sp. NPDC088449]|nr:hypothetical protein [Pantoea floridensis]
MAQEPLQLRRALGAPRAFVHPLGELYVEDGSHDLAGEPGGARRRLPVPPGEALTVAEPASPAAKQRGRSKKMSAQE